MKQMTLARCVVVAALGAAACGPRQASALDQPLSIKNGCHELKYDPAQGPNWFNVDHMDPRHVRIATGVYLPQGARFVLLYVPLEIDGQPYSGPRHADARVVSVTGDLSKHVAVARVEPETAFEPTEAFGPIADGDVVQDARLEYEEHGERRLDSPLGRPQTGNRHIVGPYTLWEISYRCGDNLFQYESWVRKGSGPWHEIEAQSLHFRAAE